MLVVAAEFTAAWRRTEGGGGKDPLPAPLAAGVGPFSGQGLGQVTVTCPNGEVPEIRGCQTRPACAAGVLSPGVDP